MHSRFDFLFEVVSVGAHTSRFVVSFSSPTRLVVKMMLYLDFALLMEIWGVRVFACFVCVLGWLRQ